MQDCGYRKIKDFLSQEIQSGLAYGAGGQLAIIGGGADGSEINVQRY